MNLNLSLKFVSNILKRCDCNQGSGIYSLLPATDHDPQYFSGLYAHNIGNLPKMIESGIKIICQNKPKAVSFEDNLVKTDKEYIHKTFSDFISLEKMKNINITTNKTQVSLAALSHIYFLTFFRPVQFFIPYSSSCSGQWQLWDTIDFLNIKQHIENISSLNMLLPEKTWDINITLENFNPIIVRRLKKEGNLNRSLDPESMIKALIIRLGELASPNINYENIDLTIRKFFTFLAVKKYLRIDREMRYLQLLEENIKRNIQKI